MRPQAEIFTFSLASLRERNAKTSASWERTRLARVRPKRAECVLRTQMRPYPDPWCEWVRVTHWECSDSATIGRRVNVMSQTGLRS